MCGIVGYIGNKEVAPLLLSGLSKLEYRGYDSAGIAVIDQNKNIKIEKVTGRLKALYQQTNDGKDLTGNIGIGHTRWATHGKPSINNAHPHNSSDCQIVGVHNGIIENYQELKTKLQKLNYSFYSDTDTEVAIKLIDYYYTKYNQNPLLALKATMLRLVGSYALGIIFKNIPNQIFVIKKDSPVVIGQGHNEAYVASDTLAFIEYCQDYYYLDNYTITQIDENKNIHFYDIDLQPLKLQLHHLSITNNDATLGNFKHYMIKEIHEQPAVFKNNLEKYVNNNQINYEKFPLSTKQLQQIQHIDIIGCGSAYHVGIIGKYLIEEYARVSVNVEIASEYRYRNPIFKPNSLAIIISQSGETADSLAALKLAKENKVPVLAITNVVNSHIEREADYIMNTFAGREVAVATTKAYTCQLLNIYLLAIELAYQKQTLNHEQYINLLIELSQVPNNLEQVINDQNQIAMISNNFINCEDIFYLGRGIDYGISLESSLKLKEISYIHSEAYPSGELKHGTISLIENNTLVIGILTNQHIYEKTISNMLETKARGATLLTVSSIIEQDNISDYFYYLKNPFSNNNLNIFATIVFFQLFAYYIAVNKGLDVDKPRNLAKSVTVE